MLNKIDLPFWCKLSLINEFYHLIYSPLRVASSFGSLRGFYGDHKYDEQAFCSNPDGFRF